MMESSLETVEVLGLASRDRDISVPVSHCAWLEAVMVSFTGLF
jgi:hypothetical protein